MTNSPTDVHPAWLPPAALRPVGARRVHVAGDGPLVATVRAEVAAATTAHGGALVDDPAAADLVLTVDPALDGADAFVVGRRDGVTTVRAGGDAGLLHALHHVVRQGEAAFGADHEDERHAPVEPVRMLDHWDNMTVHPVMGQVERGYAGGSIFYADGKVRHDLSRVEAYARLLGSVGINAVGLNNVNVHATEARLLTDHLDGVVRLAAAFRPHGVRVYLSVSFAAPMTVGGLPSSDPLDPDVQAWWADAAARVYAAVPDFGGFVVKADSEGQPGPFAYGRDHADGANLLARALAPFGGTVFWRAFVYDHHQDWRDRSTDRARAAYDHFAPLDGRFDDNVVLQVKYGPMDFQTREPVSPVIAAMPRTRLAVELQVTQEYTGQQRHAVWLGPQWSQILRFGLWGDGGRTVADVAAGAGAGTGAEGAGAAGTGAARTGGIVAVSNVGDDPFWTGHPLAQANLYTFARLAWDPSADPVTLLDEWIGLTFPDAAAPVRDTLHGILDDSWRTYEDYTAPLGVGFMVRPGHHYGPDVDGYEYTPWGTYHFADRDGIGVDRTRATGTGYTGQYPAPWREVYEDVATCPDELLLFFHHVPWSHVLHSGVSVAQHVYDTHWAGAERTGSNAAAWTALADEVPDDLHARVTERLAEQVRSAHEWRDQLCTYVFRHSGIPDARGRRIY
ncbi:xylan alpha-1,2-glucuronidase [Cellulomonas chitinilytica]|uniref:Xylan alpha-1,2-glucuronidase n=1 Tax=Cellulomonas chitinilytica TaxID=398759 RepID=A0A919P1E4_9CELL|nr:alpha-glucuronidase [Cellulomonas chitinilytica]GIG21492.1 xylan alpha-1,2-glucuronidase [Cellulomonas chitinilytica]